MRVGEAQHFLPALLGASLLTSACVYEAPSPAEEPVTVVVSDLMGGRVRAFDGSTGADLGDPMDALAAEAAMDDPFQPAALSWDREALYVGDFNSGRVLAVPHGAPEAISILHDNSSPQARELGLRLEEPADMQLWDGMLVVLGNDTRNLLIIDPELGAIDSYGGSNPIRHGHGLAWLDGDLVVARSRSDLHTPLLELWDPELGEEVEAMGDPDVLGDATALITDGDDGLLVLDFFGNRLMRLDASDGSLLEDDLMDGLLDGPRALDRAPDGSLYVLDAQGVWHLDGQAHTLVVEAEDAGLTWPRQLRVLPRLP